MAKRSRQPHVRRHISLHPMVSEKLDKIADELGKSASAVVDSFVQKYKLKS